MRETVLFFVKVFCILIFLLLIFGFSQPTPIYRKVYVEWVDIIATDSGWHSKEEVDYWIRHEGDTVKQTGFLYLETKTHIVLIDSFISYNYLGAATKIPKGNIIKMERF